MKQRLLLLVFSGTTIITIATIVSIAFLYSQYSKYRSVEEHSLQIIRSLNSIQVSGMRFVSSTNELSLILAEQHHAEENVSHSESLRDKERQLIDTGWNELIGSYKKYTHLLTTNHANSQEKRQALPRQIQQLHTTSQHLINLKKRGVHGDAVLSAKEEFEKAEVTFISTMQELVEREYQRIDETGQNMIGALKYTAYVVAFLLILAILIILSVKIFVSRHIITPLGKLTDAANRIAHDESRKLGVKASGNDEISALTRALAGMLDHLYLTTIDNAFLESIIETISQPMVVANNEGHIERANQAASDLFGYSREELASMLACDLFGGSAESELFGFNALVRNQRISALSTKILDKNGVEIPVMLSAGRLHNGDNELSGAAYTFTDMREFLSLEAQFVQSQKMEALGTLVGGIAHDFNNLLSGASGNLYLMKKHITGIPEALKKLETVEKIMLSAADMVRSLLTFARRGTMQKQDFDLIPFFKEFYRIARTTLPESITLDMELPEHRLFISGDISQIQQVLLNLVINARDALENTKNPVIHLRLEEFLPDKEFQKRHPDMTRTPLARISIQDNGAGIEKALQHKIFEPFFTTKEADKGTGLGLAMAYGAIQTHGGTIEMDSEPGAGTTFSIYLPKQEPVKASRPKIESEVIVSVPGKTVLVVDDEPGVRESAHDVLESLGYKVLLASSGEEAIHCFKKDPKQIDLVLLDVVMPGVGGVATAKKLRKIRSDITIVFSTGYDRDGTLSEGMPDTSEWLLEKPYTVQTMSQVIEYALGSGPSKKSSS